MQCSKDNPSIKKKSKRTRRFLSYKNYLLLNLVLVLFPFILFVPFQYNMIRQNIQDEILKLHQSSMEQTAQNIDTMFLSFGSCAASVSIDKNLTPYVLKKGNYDTVSAISSLMLHTSMLNMDEVFFIMNDYDTFFSKSGGVTFSTFCKLYETEGGWNIEELQLWASKTYAYQISDYGNLLIQKRTEKKYIIVAYPWYSNRYRVGSVLGLLPENYFAEQFMQDNGTRDVVVMVLNNEEELLYCNNEQFLDGLSISDIYDAKPTQLILDGETYFIVSAASETVPWQYFSFIPESSINIIMLPRLTFWIWLILVFMTILIILGVLFALRIWAPVDQLSTMLSDADIPPSSSGGKKRPMIYEKVQGILEKHTQMNQDLNKAHDYIQQQTLVQIINGNEEQDQLRLSSNPTDGFCAVVVGCTQLTPAEREDVYLLLHKTYCCTIVERRIVVIYIGEATDQSLRQFVDRLANACDMYGESFGLWVGRIVPSQAQINRSYIDAIAAASIENGSRIIYFDDFDYSHTSLSHERRLSIVQRRLFEAMRRGNIPILEEALDEMKQCIEAEYLNSDSQHFFYTLNNITYQLSTVLDDLGLDGDKNDTNRLLYCDKPSAFIRVYKDICRSTAKLCEDQCNGILGQQMEDILANIDAQFTRQDLSLSIVAEQFSVPLSTLSRMFADRVGICFIDYLSDLRLQEAKKLLRETDLSIREIVARVGYLDPSSFTRKFTRRYSISPSQYRKQFHTDTKDEEM